MKKRQWKRAARLFRVAITGVLLLLLLSGLSATATQGYEPASNGRLIVVGEPDNISPYVEYYNSEAQTELDKEEIEWVDGGVFGGKAVRLDGKGTFFRMWKEQLRTDKITFAGWINWQGVAEGMEENTRYEQHLFSISNGETIWLTFQPHYRGAEPDETGKISDGIFTEYRKGKKILRQERLAVDGEETFALPQNEWHHVAVVMDGENLSTYIDGTLWAQDSLLVHVTELGARYFTLGGRINPWSNTTLNALVDEVYLYNTGLSEEQIKMLVAGLDPLDEQTQLPDPEPPYIPQAPVTTKTTHQTIAKEVGSFTRPGENFFVGTVFGLPKLTVYLVGGILALFLILCVVVNIYHFTHDGKGTYSSSSGPVPKNKTGGGRK